MSSVHPFFDVGAIDLLRAVTMLAVAGATADLIGDGAAALRAVTMLAGEAGETADLSVDLRVDLRVDLLCDFGSTLESSTTAVCAAHRPASICGMALV